MPETPEQIFARLMPGYDLAKARRTKEGFPYVYEEAEFEPGTYGQRSAGKPLVRVSPKAKPWELEHELEHVRQLYRGDNLDEGYDEERQARMYQSYGLTPDEAYGLAYGMRPSEMAARKAAGDPGEVFARLMQRIEQLKQQRAQMTARPQPRVRLSDVDDARMFEMYRRSPEGGFAATRGPKYEAWKAKRLGGLPAPPE